MTNVGTRKFVKADKKAIQDIAFLTGYMGDSAEHFWRHKQSFTEIWTSYYVDHEPDSLYIAMEDSSVVGYLTGCLNTALGPKSENIFQSAIMRYRLLFRPGTAGFLWRAMLDGIKDKRGAKAEFIDERWPAHLHINLLPIARGTGLGAALMETWLEQLRQSGVPGCHLSTLIENTRAVLFFEKMGFKKHGEPSMVPGMRGRHGERLHQQIMVWNR